MNSHAPFSPCVSTRFPYMSQPGLPICHSARDPNSRARFGGVGGAGGGCGSDLAYAPQPSRARARAAQAPRRLVPSDRHRLGAPPPLPKKGEQDSVSLPSHCFGHPAQGAHRRGVREIQVAHHRGVRDTPLCDPRHMYSSPRYLVPIETEAGRDRPAGACAPEGGQGGLHAG